MNLLNPPSYTDLQDYRTYFFLYLTALLYRPPRADIVGRLTGHAVKALAAFP